MERQIHAERPVGTLIQGRYVIEELLGRGGFGAVYLVRDQQETARFIALKELHEQNASERERLWAECAILERLSYPSLPAVYGVFEQDQRTYMLMEYIAGTNLEILRKQQPEQRFPFSLVVSLMQPIIEAVSYLHTQEPPLMHRDIKPANMIVREDGGPTCLVDFGVAKEYVVDATTTAVRHCSPGYSSPEQYSSIGTNPRVDVYSLGATCYTLLTGTPPTDALQRMTRLANKGDDPLIPVRELAPAVPASAAAAIALAMRINAANRFSTPAAFWQAFTDAVPLEDEAFKANPLLPSSHLNEHTKKQVEYFPDASVRVVQAAPFTRQSVPWTHAWPKRLIMLVLLMLLTLGSLLGLGFWLSIFHATSTPMQSYARVKPTQAALRGYPALATAYTGTLDNLLTHTTTPIRLLHVQQSAQTFRASLQIGASSQFYVVSGVIDLSRRLLFTMAAPANQPALAFSGLIRSDHLLVGNYCSTDTSGQCANGAYGLWTLAPVRPASAVINRTEKR